MNWANSVTEIFVITVEELEPATSSVRDQDATTVPAINTWEIGSLNWLQFMLQWFITFPEFAEFTEFLLNLGKTPINTLLSYWKICLNACLYNSSIHVSTIFCHPDSFSETLKNYFVNNLKTSYQPYMNFIWTLQFHLFCMKMSHDKHCILYCTLE